MTLSPAKQQYWGYSLPFERLEYLASRTELDDTGCINWIGYIDNYGYGTVSFYLNGTLKAHRIFYMLYVGEIPDGMTIDHLCLNKRCVNVEHLEVVTASENSSRVRAAEGKRTHCGRGHEYTEENTIYDKKTGKRRCRTCRMAYQASRKSQKKK